MWFFKTIARICRRGLEAGVFDSSMLGACSSVRDQFEREERNEYMTKIMLCVFLFLSMSWSVRVCACAYFKRVLRDFR